MSDPGVWTEADLAAAADDDYDFGDEEDDDASTDEPS